jgi:hypothetical protein
VGIDTINTTTIGENSMSIYKNHALESYITTGEFPCMKLIDIKMLATQLGYKYHEGEVRHDYAFILDALSPDETDLFWNYFNASFTEWENQMYDEMSEEIDDAINY